MEKAITRYEPRHRIILWDDSELTIKSSNVSALEAELKKPETSFVRIGEDLIHKNSIRRITPAVAVISELEAQLAGKPQEVKEKVRAKAKEYRAEGKELTPGVINNMIEHFTN